jgi:serine/threonine protein kinase
MVAMASVLASTEHTPARWMPLEVLQSAQFSHKSDVFPFGVLLWEIMSLGQTSWGAFGVSDFVAALQNGEWLQFPATMEHDPIAQVIYKIALRCWSSEPRKRPPFSSFEGELAVHRTVATATAATSMPGAAVGGALDDSRDGHETQYPMLPMLDADGYEDRLTT